MGKEGFTLIEALLVLFIITVIGVVSQALTLRVSDAFIDERVLAQFKYDLLLTQALAMSSQADAQLEIFDGDTYKVTSSRRSFQRTLPQHTTISHTSAMGRVAQFKATGTTNTIGAFYYRGRDRKSVV